MQLVTKCPLPPSQRGTVLADGKQQQSVNLTHSTFTIGGIRLDFLFTKIKVSRWTLRFDLVRSFSISLLIVGPELLLVNGQRTNTTRDLMCCHICDISSVALLPTVVMTSLGQSWLASVCMEFSLYRLSLCSLTTRQSCCFRSSAFIKWSFHGDLLIFTQVVILISSTPNLKLCIESFYWTRKGQHVWLEAFIDKMTFIKK